MGEYVKKQTAGEIIKHAVEIYFNNFLLIIPVFLLTIPFTLLQDVVWAFYGKQSMLVILVTGLNYFVSLLIVLLVVTVLVSDICVHNKPSLPRSLKRLRVITLSKLALTYLIAGIGFAPGLLFNAYGLTTAAISPTLRYSLVLLLMVACYTLMMLFPSVLVLKDLWGWEAIKRSISLSRGYYLRNFSIIAGIYMLYIVLYLLSFFIFIIIMGGFEYSFWLFVITNNMVGLLVKPLASVALVLLFYDMQARSAGGYDPNLLATDINR